MKIKKSNAALGAALVLSAGILFSGCAFRPENTEEPSDEPFPLAYTENIPETTPEPPKNAVTYTVTYMDGAEVLSRETVVEGGFPLAETEPQWENATFLGWEAGGKRLDVTEVPVMHDVTYTAAEGPSLHREGGYMEGETDGLFHPSDPFTRSDASRTVYALLKDKPRGETFLNDVTTRARCYQSATALVTEGWMTLSNGYFEPDIPIQMTDLKALLENMFSARSVAEQTAQLGETLTRGEAAVLFEGLLGGSRPDEAAYYPDVSPEREDYGAVSSAGTPSGRVWGTDGGGLQPGFIHLEGYLYYVGEDGYFLRNTNVGELLFGEDCRYTSGNQDLDAHVAELLSEIINDGMTEDQKLRAVYDYVRDHYLYLKRNLYEVGETGWEMEEALTMFTTGKGNCYNFTGAFWALTRGLGYESYCVSGLVGKGRDPHSWVEIPMSDGITYIFDPETEMSYRLQENGDWAHLYKLTYEEGEYWSYAREPYPDEPEPAA